MTSPATQTWVAHSKTSQEEFYLREDGLLVEVEWKWTVNGFCMRVRLIVDPEERFQILLCLRSLRNWLDVRRQPVFVRMLDSMLTVASKSPGVWV